MTTFRCESLSHAYDAVIALNDVSLRFEQGTITAIIGPNGAGKTTLVDVLTGFLRPNDGRWYCGNHEITGYPAFRISRLGVARTFQDLRLIERITVLENVLLAHHSTKGESFWPTLLGLGRREESRKEWLSKDLLDFVGLGREPDALAGTLSFGQQKLLALACCLGTGAAVLFLDEPVAGVHPRLAEELLSKLRDLCDAGKTIVFIEHDLVAVRQVADRLVVMDQGSIIADGQPGEVLEEGEILSAYIT